MGERGGVTHGIISTTFAAERHGLVVVEAFVDDAVGEHALGGDAEDESAEAGSLA